MKRGANSCLQKTVFAFLFVGYVLFVVAFFIPRWFQFTQTGTGKQYNYGIFMACIRDDDGSSRCQYTHFKNVEAGTILALKVLASFGLVSYTVAMATGFLALCWIKEKRQRLFYVSVVCSIIAAIFIIISVAIHKSHRSYDNGSDDVAFYIAIVSIFPLVYGAFMGFLVARTMTFDDEKEDEEKIHKEQRQRRKKKRDREPVFMFPPTGTMIPEIKKKPLSGIVVTSDDFERSESEDPFFFKPLTVKNDKYEAKQQDKEVEELSGKLDQYDIDPNLDENEASMDNVDVYNPSTGLTSPNPPPAVTPVDAHEEITSEPWNEDQEKKKEKRKKKGLINLTTINAPLKIADLMKKTRALNKTKKESKKQKKKREEGRPNSAFEIEEIETGKVDVHGQTKIHGHRVEQLPDVEK